LANASDRLDSLPVAGATAVAADDWNEAIFLFTTRWSTQETAGRF